MQKADVKQARAYQMIERVKREKAIDVRTAANYVAAKLGIDVQKGRFGLTELDRERLGSVLQSGSPLGYAGSERKRSKKASEQQVIKIGTRLVETLLLSSSMIKQAADMSDVYPLIYVLENSFRQLVSTTLEAKHGKDWWTKATISNPIRKNVDSRMKQEDENRWHARRGAHPIFYTDFSDIGSIIINNWSEFEHIFHKQYRLQAKFEEIELSRNIIAHNNPLPEKEIKRLKLNFDDWISTLKER
jgi:hypothetical protein